MENNIYTPISDTVREKLIVALDYADLNQAAALVEQLGERVSVYKAGLEIFLRTNGEIVDYLHAQKKKVFLDLKFHDITNTVVQSCLFAVEKEVFMFNVHCSNGEKTMRTVAGMLQEKQSKSICIGVTVLTNLNGDDLQNLHGNGVNVENTVKAMAAAVSRAGLHGIVCSAHEASLIKREFGNEFITVCPGVRPAFTQSGLYTQNRKEDQARIMTAYDAVKNGADYLVIGRPITQHPDPVQAVSAILDEIRQAV